MKTETKTFLITVFCVGCVALMLVARFAVADPEPAPLSPSHPPANAEPPPAHFNQPVAPVSWSDVNKGGVIEEHDWNAERHAQEAKAAAELAARQRAASRIWANQQARTAAEASNAAFVLRMQRDQMLRESHPTVERVR
jgi:hypothetical protein